MNVVIAASEAVPFSKTGGLADVAGALFKEYLKMGINAYLFVPLYRITKEQYKDEIKTTGMSFDVSLGNITKECRVFSMQHVFFIENDDFFNREDLYGTQYGDYHDNGIRFAFFCKSIIEICKRIDIHFDIIHCNDWQTGLIPLYLKILYRDNPIFKGTKSVFTIHNLGYQGLFPPETMDIIGLGWDLFNPEGIEFYGNISFLKAGIIGADLITTVSKTYSKEILTPEFGYGLDGLLRKRKDSIVGIPNGIDYSEWDPSRDKFLSDNYTRANLSGKEGCKKELINRCSLAGGIDKPLLCFIGRLSRQKGLDILIEAIPDLIKIGINFVIIGRGEDKYQGMLWSLRHSFPENLFFYQGFDEPFAHLCYAGSDMFLMPSLYEPGGLGQLIAMRYGSIPIARNTGGPSETIEDGVTGFLFEEYSADALMNSVKVAVLIYTKYKKLWISIVKKAMGMDFSWSKSAKAYIDAYKGLMTKR